MDAKEYLKQYIKLEALEYNKKLEKLKELERLDSIAHSITAQMGGERVQSSGDQQRMATAIAEKATVEAEFDRRIDELRAERQEILRTIESLNTNEYRVLHCVYIQGMDIYNTAGACKKSYRWAKSVHSNGIDNVQRMLDERTA